MAIGGRMYEEKASAGDSRLIVDRPCTDGMTGSAAMTVDDHPESFPDSVIIACVHEAARRADQIEREAMERVAALRKALANPNPPPQAPIMCKSPIRGV